MCHSLGGQVEPGHKREFGHANVSMKSSRLFKDIEGANAVQVWMSHGDKVTKLPSGFSAIASTPSCQNAAVEDPKRRMWGVQFHPEVTHTPCGAKMIRNFVRDICGAKGTWNMQDFVRMQANTIVSQLGSKTCVGAVSGGVDSTVAAALL